METVKAIALAFAQAVGLADFLAKWGKQTHDEKTGAAVKTAENLSAQVRVQVDGQAISDDVGRLSRSELIDSLRPDARHGN
jgi:hypothetical protein